MGKFYAEIYRELDLYFSHLAWLNAVPEIDNNKLPRIEQFKKEELMIEMPDCEASHIINYMFDIGLSVGENPLTYSEIESWQKVTGLELQPWESQNMKRLSQVYLSEYRKARDKDADSKWEEIPREMTSKYRAAIRAKNAVRKIVEEK